MEEYIVVQVWNNIGDMTFKTTHKTKENSSKNCLSMFKKDKNILKYPTLIRLYN